jgi:hypothetical protein
MNKDTMNLLKGLLVGIFLVVFSIFFTTNYKPPEEYNGIDVYAENKTSENSTIEFTEITTLQNNIQTVMYQQTDNNVINLKMESTPSTTIPQIVFEVASQTTTIATIATTTTVTTTIATTVETTTEPTTVKNYSDDDLYWLSRVIDAEASDCCTDEHKMWVGVVVMNRVKSPNFPSTVKGVITQSGQYQTYSNGTIYNQPSQRSINVAKQLLSGYRPSGSEGCVWQSNFVQGQIVKVFKTSFSTTYICR